MQPHDRWWWLGLVLLSVGALVVLAPVLAGASPLPAFVWILGVPLVLLGAALLFLAGSPGRRVV